MTTEVAGRAVAAARVHQFDGRAMGSPLRLTVVGRTARAAMAAWRSVVAEFEAAEQAMSRFRASSDLMSVDRAAGDDRPIPVDRRLTRALVAADRAGRITDGRFDARVLGTLERLGYAGADVGPATAADQRDRTREGRSRDVGVQPDGPGRWLRADPRASVVSVTEPVDLGGIGKGLTLRWTWRRLDRCGFLGPDGGAMIEAGGDLIAGGAAPQDGPWIIAIEDPHGGEPPIATVAVVQGAIATSSILVHRWTAPDGRQVHHLIDPRTSEPGGAGLASVTVAGPDPAWAEVWSKTLFLHGAEGIATVARQRGLTAWWVRDDGRLEMTAGARARTTWVAAEA